MQGRNAFGLVLSVLLLLAAAGSGLARGPQPTGSSEAAGANAGPAASAPWFKTEVDTPGNTGQHTSVAIDPFTGGTYVSYYDAQNKDLRMAHYVGSGGNCAEDNDWHCQTVDSGGDVGKYNSIAIDPVTQGELGIAYHDATNGKLKYAECTSAPDCDWSVHTIDSGIFPVSTTGLFTSLKFGSWGGIGSYYTHPRIVYHFDNPTNVDALMFAYYRAAPGGNCGYGDVASWWDCSTVATGEGVGQYASLAADRDGGLWIAYYEGGNGDLWYAEYLGTGNNWASYPVTGSTTDAGQHASLYVDDDMRFHIAYYDATNDELKYAVEVDSGGNCGILGSARCVTIDSMPAGYHPLGMSIAEDAAGHPIIAYQSASGSLNVARPLAALGLPAGSGNCGPESPFATWRCDTIDRSGTWVRYRNGDYASIAVNSAGLATIAYYGFVTSSDGNLTVSYQRLQAFLPVSMKRQ
jgi:hypothetical protein